MTVRADILNHIRSTIVALPAFNEERVKIGLFDIKRLHHNPAALIQPGANRGALGDCGRTTRTMGVTVGLIAKMDRLKAEADWLQLDAAYESVHLALEGLTTDAVGGHAQMFNEGGGGVLATGYDDIHGLAYVACDWEVVFDRDLGSA